MISKSKIQSFIQMFAVLCGLVCFLFCKCIGAHAQLAMYAKFENIDGGSMDSKFEEWTPITDLSVTAGALGPGADRERSGVQVFDFAFSFDATPTYAPLVEASSFGRVFNDITFALTTTFGDSGRETFLEYRLEQAVVAPVSLSANADNGEFSASSNIADLNSLRITQTEFDKDGKKGDTIITTIDYEKGTQAVRLVTASALAGDYDFNGVTDQRDYDVWTELYSASSSAADGNGDGVVAGYDFLHWQRNLGAGGDPTASANFQAVPEPSSLALLVLTVLPFGRREATNIL